MTTVSGEIVTPPDVLTHTEPTNLTGVDASGGVETIVELGAYTNTGNVAQVVTLSVADIVRCTEVQAYFGTVATNTSLTLAPGTSATATVRIVADASNIGQAYSFTVNSDWDKSLA